jgi:hypothetical protein
VTIFGIPWNQLELEHVRRFLDDAGPEPLLWEAKGIRADKGEIRRQVCGFANSHEGGYLIIGADETGGGWTLEGVEFPNEPPLWISSIVGNGGVTPYPEGLDTRAWSIGQDRGLAVVRIPAIAAPPCNTHGTVYERVSGRTISVREPLRLAALFERGDQARRSALANAEEASDQALTDGRGHQAHDAVYIQFGLGLAAAGYLPDISSRLFSEAFEEAVVSSIRSVLTHGGLLGSGGPQILGGVTQNSRSFQTTGGDPRLGHSWSVRITWNGAISIYWVRGVTQTHIPTVVDGPLRVAWSGAEEMLKGLGPQGQRYLRVGVCGGGSFPRNDPPVIPGLIGHRNDAAVVARGPLEPGVNNLVLEGITRELRRSIGDMVYEPPGNT